MGYSGAIVCWLDGIPYERFAGGPMLQGTIRDHVTKKRRPMVRYFVCEKDVSHEPPETPLPEAVLDGDEPFMIWGAIAGG